MSERIRHVKSLERKYQPLNFKTGRRSKSPSPRRKDYEKQAVTKATKERCMYIDPDLNKRCQMEIGMYPKYCHIHTTLIENLFLGPSNIKGAGGGLFVGPLGFNKGDIIGEYSQDWMKVKQGRLDKRNGKDSKGNYRDVNYSYVYCDEQKRGQKEADVQCWDGLDKNSTIVRNSNDAHGSKYRNNAYFDTRKDKNGKVHVYMIATRRIRPLKEVLTNYGDSYW